MWQAFENPDHTPVHVASRSLLGDEPLKHFFFNSDIFLTALQDEVGLYFLIYIFLQKSS